MHGIAIQQLTSQPIDRTLICATERAPFCPSSVIQQPSWPWIAAALARTLLVQHKRIEGLCSRLQRQQHWLGTHGGTHAPVCCCTVADPDSCNSSIMQCHVQRCQTTRICSSNGTRYHTHVAAAAKGRGRYQQDSSSSTDADQVIAPVSPFVQEAAVQSQYQASPSYTSSSDSQGRGSRAGSRQASGRPGKPTSPRHDSRRGSLVKIRVPPRRCVGDFGVREHSCHL